MEGATQCAPPWPLTPIPRQNPRLLAQGSVSPKHAEVLEEIYDIKQDVSTNNVYVKDTWPELAPVKFEPAMELDPCQALDETTDDSRRKICGESCWLPPSLSVLIRPVGRLDRSSTQ